MEKFHTGRSFNQFMNIEHPHIDGIADGCDSEAELDGHTGERGTHQNHSAHLQVMMVI